MTQFTLLSLLSIMYLVVVQPKEQILSNRLEIFNEIFTYLCGQHALLFLMVSLSPSTLQGIGWSLCFCLCFNIAVNMIIIVKGIIRDIRKWWKKNGKKKSEA